MSNHSIRVLRPLLPKTENSEPLPKTENSERNLIVVLVYHQLLTVNRFSSKHQQVSYVRVASSHQVGLADTAMLGSVVTKSAAKQCHIQRRT